MDIRIDGRTAIVTGGSKGLGFATAMRLAESGGNVAILARSRPTLDEAPASIRKSGKGRIEGYTCDVTKAEDCERAYASVVGDFGTVDILINNAGQHRSGPFETITDQVWQEDFDQKVMGAVRMARLVWPKMKAQRWGRVINVLATTAKNYRVESAPTSISRAAGLALTKVLAGEGAPHNILVNAIMVGSIVSDQIARRHKARTDGITLDQMIVETGKKVPLGRMGRAEEFANLACFLASDAASYVAGTSIPVDGGSSPFI